MDCRLNRKRGLYAVVVAILLFSSVQTLNAQQGVVTVPWRIIGGVKIPHDTWTGKQIRMKAVASNAALPLTYGWHFDDGTGDVTGTVTTIDQAYAIEAQHTFTGSIGTPFRVVCTVQDNNGMVSMDTVPVMIRDKTLSVETNVAIDEALWYIHKAMTRSTSDTTITGYLSGYSSYWINSTGSALQAFEINGHYENGAISKDPYCEDAKRFMNMLLLNLTTNTISGVRDGNGNGIALAVNSDRAIYELGAAMDGIISSGTPDAIASVGATNVKGRKYRDIIQDMADMYSYYQTAGGWRYSWGSDRDNSACQWAAIGMIPAERLWGCTIPSVVKSDNYDNWLSASFSGDATSGTFGYNGIYPAWNYEATTASGMVQLIFDGKSNTDPQWTGALNWFSNDWNTFLNNTLIYGFYSFAKSMRLMTPAIINLPNGISWYDDNTNGIARRLLNTQGSDGSWNYVGYQNGYFPAGLQTPWSTVILTPSLFQLPPVAVPTGAPNPAAVGQTVNFDGSGSYHTDPFHKIVSYQWDFDASNGIDWNHPDAVGPSASHAFGALGSYTVSLRVVDDNVPPLTSVATVQINVTIPPHPPTAVPGGPYFGVAGEPFTLDGSGSFDVDQPLGDKITAYGWELTMQQPRDFNDASGVSPQVVFNNSGTFTIGLRVTDNTKIAFPQSGQDNLTNDAYTTVKIYGNCIRNLAARPKLTKMLLNWTDNGHLPYRIFRSTKGPDITGMTQIGTSSSLPAFIDYNVEMGKDYWYRVADASDCYSYALKASSAGRMSNRPPVISSHPVMTAQEALSYAYTVKATDPEGTKVKYYLEQAPSGMKIDSLTGAITWIPGRPAVGRQNVLIRVADAGGAEASQFFTISVAARPNTAPSAHIVAIDKAMSGDAVLFDASSSTDAENDVPFTYSWSFGDGQIGTGASVKHTFSARGSYIVTVFVTDSRGATGKAEHTIVIDKPNTAPVAVPGGPYTGRAGSPILFDGSKSTDADGDKLVFSWFFGVSPSTPGTGATPVFTYDNPGTYTGTLTVSDGRGGISTASFQVTIGLADNPPVGHIKLDKIFGNVGDVFHFDATGSTDPDNDKLVYTWQFGDNVTMNGDVVTHYYQAPGSYHVSLKVDDQRGKTSQVDTAIHINAPPAFMSTPPESTYEDSPVLYTAHAVDPDGDAVTFSLINPPSGMTIDAATGKIAWTPDDPAVGIDTVKIKVDDGKGRFALQVVGVRVINVNDPPSITSTPITTVNETAVYSYSVIGKDVDAGDVLSYSLVTAPSGMSINDVSGVLTWTPAHSDLGKHSVTVKVEDLAKAFATQTFELDVKELPWPPKFTSTPITSATEHQLYSYQATASDLNSGDVFSFNVLSAPQGFAINASTGLATWTPGEADVGVQAIRLRVTDGSLADTQSYSLTVINVNDPPVITSSAPIQAAVSALYTYAVKASDPDAGDVVSFSLVKGSGNAAIDAASGVLHWTPAATEVGPQSLTVRATDKGGLFADQNFSVNVQLAPKPPVFTSTPVLTATEHQLYSYRATAADPNNDVLLFALVSGPAGMTVSANGLVQFTPAKKDVGNQAVTISVTDGGFVVNQSFTITVTGINDPPIITSVAPTGAVQGALYRYQVMASDPDNDALTYRLVSAPSGMTINAATGLILWPDNGARSNGAMVALEVSDGKGGVVDQNWTISIVADNIAPVVSIGFSANPVMPGTMAVVSVNATDNVAVAKVEMTMDGSQVTLDANQQYSFTTGSLGDHVFSATAYDGAGNAGHATATLSISTSADNTPPVVTLDYSPKTPAVGQQVTFAVGATDNKGIDKERVWLKVDDQYVHLDANGTGYYTPLVKGVVTALATAYDLSGNYGEKQVQFNASLAGSDNVSPTAAITSPNNDTVITQPINLIGTANDANFAYYTLSYADRDNPQYTEYYQSTTPVVNGVLGKIDPTLLENGIYLFKLTVFDKYGNYNSTTVQAQADGRMKLGNFTLSFTDMKLMLSGINLEVDRVYDSRDKLQGDFGIGWRLGVKNSVKLNENRVPGHGWTTECTKSIFGICLEWGLTASDDHFITVQIPGAPKQEFTVNVQTDYADESGLAEGRLTFQARTGTYSTLEALDNVEFSFLMDGELLDMDFLPINPNHYRLTLLDGTKYDIDQNLSSVTKISDKNNNSITITDNAIVHSTGSAIQFTRDAEGRITAIDDGTGRTIRYAYDGHGNLQTVTDPEGNTTKFKYGPRSYLTEIYNALGVRVTRVEFDDQGRFIRQINPGNDTISLTHNIAQKEEIMTDLMGKEEHFQYDDKGNIIRKTDQMGNVWSYTFDQWGNRTSIVDPLNHVVSSTYDTAGNKLTQTDAAGAITRYSYDPKGNLLSVTDPLGRISKNVFDASGNITQRISPTGAVTGYTYNSAGQLSAMTDPAGNMTQFTYDYKGRVVRLVRPNGDSTHYEFDDRGNQTAEIRFRKNSSGTVEELRTTFVYDDNSRVVKQINPMGDSALTEYNTVGLTTAKIDNLGRRTTTDYDAFGRVVKITYPDGADEKIEYNRDNRKSAFTDRSGRTTRYAYDDLGRLIQTTSPDGTTMTTTFDALGNIIAETDGLGNTTHHEYDAVGRRIKTTDPLGNKTLFGFDVGGNMTSLTNANNQVISYTYDDANRKIKTTFKDGTFESSVYNNLGQEIEKTDQAGLTTKSDYNASGRLLKVTDALGNVTQYSYDEAGNRLSQTDAKGRTTMFEYDKLGRKTRHTLPGGAFETFTFNAAGNIAAQTDFSQKTTNFTYDINNNLSVKTPPDGRVEKYFYTPSGKKSMAIIDGDTTRYQYDLYDRLTNVQSSRSGESIQYAYDKKGNRVSLTTPAGETKYTYDAAGRMLSMTDPDGGVSSFTYDAIGNKISHVYPNGLRTDYTYDDLNRLIFQKTTDAGGAVIASYAYTLGKSGNRLHVVENSGRSVDYTYDNDYELVREAITSSLGVHSERDYSYDAVGNRISQTIDGVSTNYTYDDNNHLLSDGVTTFTYDGNGNLKNKASGTQQETYVFSSTGLLLSVIQAGNGNSHTIEYGYSSKGDRVLKKVDGAVVSKYLVDGNTSIPSVIEERDGNGTLVAQYSYADEVVSQHRASGKQYFVYDGHLSTRFLVNEAAQVTDSYDYDAYGVLLSKTGNSANEFLYTGQQYDANLKLYYLRARYYDPANGRFISPDAFQGLAFDPLSLHKYLYCKNSPVSNYDPLGYEDLGDCMAAVAIAGILSSMALGTYSAFTGGDYTPDASILGYSVTATGMSSGMILSFLGAAISEAAFLGLDKLFDGSIGQELIAGIAAIGSSAQGITGGAELVADAVDKKLALYGYAGAAVAGGEGASGISLTVYTGVVWNCKKVTDYKGPFQTASITGTVGDLGVTLNWFKTPDGKQYGHTEGITFSNGPVLPSFGASLVNYFPPTILGEGYAVVAPFLFLAVPPTDVLLLLKARGH